MFGAAKYLALARQSADVVWRRGLLQKGCGLCHGTAGNAYSLLYLYQVRGGQGMGCWYEVEGKRWGVGMRWWVRDEMGGYRGGKPGEGVPLQCSVSGAIRVPVMLGSTNMFVALRPAMLGPWTSNVRSVDQQC